MKIQTIEYRDFRNIEEAKIQCRDGLNLLIGDNAAGKTSALEGCYLFAAGRSHRTARERDFIREGSDRAELRLCFSDSRREQTMLLRYFQQSPRERSRKMWLRNGIAMQKTSECIGHFRAVLFCPGHLSIVSGGPAERRSFLDGAISQSDGRYMAELQNYRRILQQRNELLDSYFRDRALFSATVELWSRQLAESGEKIGARRAEYTEVLQEKLREILGDMSGGREKIELQYKKALRADELFALLMQNHEREARLGCTLYGPHRDDVEIRLDNRSAREFASQGQQRSVAIAMKLGEGEISKDIHGEYPVFLLDDILSELDEGRQRYLLGGLHGRQVLLTCPAGSTVERLYAAYPVESCYRVQAGSFRQLTPREGGEDGASRKNHTECN